VYAWVAFDHSLLRFWDGMSQAYPFYTDILRISLYVFPTFYTFDTFPLILVFTANFTVEFTSVSFIIFVFTAFFIEDLPRFLL
jgi:hypothetical protein